MVNVKHKMESLTALMQTIKSLQHNAKVRLQEAQVECAHDGIIFMTPWKPMEFFAGQEERRICSICFLEEEIDDQFNEKLQLVRDTKERTVILSRDDFYKRGSRYDPRHS